MPVANRIALVAVLRRLVEDMAMVVVFLGTGTWDWALRMAALGGNGRLCCLFTEEDGMILLAVRKVLACWREFIQRNSLYFPKSNLITSVSTVASKPTLPDYGTNSSMIEIWLSSRVSSLFSSFSTLAENEAIAKKNFLNFWIVIVKNYFH